VDATTGPRHLFVARFVDEIRTQLAADRPAVAYRVFLTLHDRFTACTPAGLTAAVTPDPGSTGSRRYDALLGGLVEWHCTRVGVGVPAWAGDPARFLPATERWYVDDSAWGRAHDPATTPPAFAHRGVYLAETELGSI
jgi:hypothetical protein